MENKRLVSRVATIFVEQVDVDLFQEQYTNAYQKALSRRKVGSPDPHIAFSTCADCAGQTVYTALFSYIIEEWE